MLSLCGIRFTSVEELRRVIKGLAECLYQGAMRNYNKYDNAGRIYIAKDMLLNGHSMLAGGHEYICQD
jgi:hypothetical protein